MNHRYTIADIRSEVLKVLDEYSFNGKNVELFSAGTADIDKRFISALNCAIRLVDSALSHKKKRLTVKFEKPDILMDICSFNLHKSTKSIDLPYFSGSVTFDFSGRGKLLFVDGEGTNIFEKELATGYGVFENFRTFVPENASVLILETKDSLSVSGLKCYEKSSIGACDSEELLPDGKRLYCRFSELCSELCGANSHKHSLKINVPCDIFVFEKGVLSCDEKYAGTYEVQYFEYPKSFCESDAEDTVLELSPVAFTAAIYATAANLCEAEDGALYSRLTYKYREILANTYPCENLCRKNSFFSGGLFGRRRKGHDFLR